jgi:hypothetical protein
VQVRAARADEHTRCERELASHHHLPSAHAADDRGRQVAEPHAHEHIALAWVRPEEFSGYNLAAADRPVVAAYRPGRR